MLTNDILMWQLEGIVCFFLNKWVIHRRHSEFMLSLHEWCKHLYHLRAHKTSLNIFNHLVVTFDVAVELTSSSLLSVPSASRLLYSRSRIWRAWGARGRKKKKKLKKMKQNTTHSDSHEAIFSRPASEAADALRYSRRISIFTWLRMRQAVEIHRAACQSDSWQICVFRFRLDQRFEGWYQYTSTDWSWWQVIISTFIFSSQKKKKYNALKRPKRSLKKSCESHSAAGSCWRIQTSVQISGSVSPRRVFKGPVWAGVGTWVFWLGIWRSSARLL